MGRKRRPLGEPESASYEGQCDPLHWALFEGDEEGAKRLLESGTCDVEAEDQLGWRPLHRACFAGLDSVVGLLLERRADPTAADAEGVGPLHVAASGGHPDCVKLLLAARADPAAPDGYAGMTPQIYAMSKEGEVGERLAELLGAVDLRLLAAWSNPAELARLAAEAETEEERQKLEEKFLEELDGPPSLQTCHRCKDDGMLSRVKVYRLRTEPEATASGAAATSSQAAPSGLGFWAAACERCPALLGRLRVQEWEEGLLGQHCSGVGASDLDEASPKKGWRLAFRFAENPYFADALLEKEYHTEEDEEGGLSVREVRCRGIHWLPRGREALEAGGGAGFFCSFFRGLRRDGELPENLDEARAREALGATTKQQLLVALMALDFDLAEGMRSELVPFSEEWRGGKSPASGGKPAAAAVAGETGAPREGAAGVPATGGDDVE